MNFRDFTTHPHAEVETQEQVAALVERLRAQIAAALSTGENDA